MTSENFVYWLQGYLEIANPKIIDPNALTEIKNHLNIIKPIYPSDIKYKAKIPTFKWFDEFEDNSKEKEKTQVYVTITNKPLWDNRGEYSYYNDSNDEFKLIADSILKMGFYDENKKYHVIIDNELNPPKTTSYNNLHTLTKYDSSNHLIANGEYVGILNIGTFNDNEALVC